MSRESRLKEQKDPGLKTIHECLKRVIEFESYDHVGGDFYRIICHKEKQPYDQWVETWLIKCIKECFKGAPVKVDIMLAHFALLPGFTLHMPIKDRLMKYVEISGYLTRYPSDSTQLIEEIKNDPDEGRKKDKLEAIAKKITKMQRNLVGELAGYIEELQSPAEHIANLGEYGELKSVKGKMIYYPFAVELNAPKSPDPPDPPDPPPSGGTSERSDASDQGVTPKQWMNFTIRVIYIIVGAFLSLVLITAVWHGIIEIPTSNGSMSIDFSMRDYTTDRQPGKEVAESICNPGSIPASPPPPLGGNSDGAKVVDGSLDSID